MNALYYIDRQTGKKQKEKVYGQTAIELLYGESWITKICAPWILPIVRMPWVSRCYGAWQRTKYSKNKIKPFIEKFEINIKEARKTIEEFHSFNDFFVRKLKITARPIDKNSNIAIMPADAKYSSFTNINEKMQIKIKGKTLSIKKIIQNDQIAEEYRGGTIVIARLAPNDYHRFHFPADGIRLPRNHI